MFAAAKFSILKGRLADVGSGAGFPGLALKIIRPELHVTLIEANAKKSAFLAEVVRDLGLNEVDVVRARYEDLPLGAIQADFIAARAVGDLQQLLPRSEEHTSELQSLAYLVCRLLLEKKKVTMQRAPGRCVSRVV